MRILAVGSMYPPHHLGGYEVLWQGAMQRARAAGHEVRVLASDHHEPGVGKEEDPDVHRTLEWFWSWEAYALRRLNPMQRFGLVRRDRAELSRHLNEFRPDVVTWWPMGGMPLALLEHVRRAGLPSVLVVIDDWLNYGPELDGWLRLWSGWRRPLAPLAARLTGIPTRFELDAASRVLFCSQFMQRRAPQDDNRLTNAAVVPPGIDPRFQQPAPERPWAWRLLCVGRLDRQKGVDTAITALAELPPQATLTIAGSGDERYVSELRAQTARLGLGERVEFTGMVARESLPELFAMADAVVFPVRWEEPWGLVPLEAMGVGRAVVSTAGGGSAEFLRDGENALVFEADDASALAACVSRLATDDNLRERLRAGGLATAATFTAEAFEQRIVEELEAAAASTR